jgi:hypothetical protein
MILGGVKTGEAERLESYCAAVNYALHIMSVEQSGGIRS